MTRRGKRKRRRVRQAPGVKQTMPFDSAYRTILGRLQRLVILLVNYLFGTSYTGDEEISFGNSGLTRTDPDGIIRTTYADSRFSILVPEQRPRKYHLECQFDLEDGLIDRFVRYNVVQALDDRQEAPDGKMIYTYPSSGVIFLKPSGQKTGDLKYSFQTQDGVQGPDLVVRALYMQRLTIAELFSRNLQALVPFYLFTRSIYELRNLERTEQGQRLLVEEAQEVVARIRRDPTLSTEERTLILELTAVVINGLIRNSRTQERMCDVVRGKVLTFEMDRMVAEAFSRGEEQGEIRGEARGEVRGEARGQAIGEARGQAIGEARATAQAVQGIIRCERGCGLSDAEIVSKLAAIFGLSPEEARAQFDENNSVLQPT